MSRDWSKPTEISDALAAFPAFVVRDLMPPMDEIPAEFRDSNERNEWRRWQADWFFSGLSAWPETKPGIDVRAAQRHLGAIQGSFEPKHEHKEAAVAYLASLWLVKPTAKRTKEPS